ncbi:hypothetical protein [Faecalibacillus intestinalis]|uniref:hypothetical protein n=1 Tax=Faecalibacillus intestinalis TaxID=1982626 RepID=UPI003522C822
MNPLTTINFDTLKSFYHITDETLNNSTINEILKMNNDMLIAKERERFETTKQDEEFKNAVMKYFTPFQMLSKYWTTDEIVRACAKHTSISSIRQIMSISVNSLSNPQKFADNNHYEYIGIDWGNIRQFTKRGEELLYPKRCKCHNFYTPAKYQSTIHGKIILELLYSKYPELEEFQFAAYGFETYSFPYEIYPHTVDCYTPFEALLTGNIAAIIARNEDYCKSYNCGEYALAKWNERVKSPEMQHYFDVIQSITKGK